MNARPDFHDPYDGMSDEQFDAYTADLLTKPPRTVPISLRLPDDLLSRVKSVARAFGTPYQTLMKRMIDVGTSALERPSGQTGAASETSPDPASHSIDLDADPGRKEVFAHYGLALGEAQLLEGHLATVLAFLGVPEPYDREAFVRLVEDLERRMLGELKKRLTETGVTMIDLGTLKQLIETRNVLVHRFFRDPERSVKMRTDQGRLELVLELDQATRQFYEMSSHLRAAAVQLAVGHGVSRTGVMQRIRKLLTEPTSGPFSDRAAKLLAGNEDAATDVVELLPNQAERLAS